MTLNERNYAGDHVVVGSLEVLGDVKGGSITQIKRNIDLVQQQAEAAIKTQNRYWEELSSDSVITPIEKQQLLKEFKSIQNSYAAIYTQAVSVGQEASQYVQDYIAAYDDLYAYLYTTLKLFNDMESSTDIENRTTFNTKFYNYYYDESFVLVALSKGLLNSVSIRVLSSLLEAGTEGEVGLYHGGLYQYTNGHWKNVTTGNYKGALSAPPVAEEDAFFLASEDFIIVEELYINDEQLIINGDTLGVTRLYKQGYIYYCRDGLWYEEQDRTNYLYVAAFADVLNITGELPQIFQDAIDNLQAQINNNKIPKYRGVSASNPATPIEGDYFVYSGTTTATRRNSDIYQYQSGEWVRLDPLLSQNSTYYMQALDDILQLNNANDGYFAALFAQALFANNAFLNAVFTKILTLRGPNGYIQSENYDPQDPESTGFRIDYEGDADFNGNTHIAGKVAIGVPLSGNTDFNTYDVIIGGNSKFGGELRGGDVYCRKLGFFELQPGNYTSWTEKLVYDPNSYAGMQSKKMRVTPCCYSSIIRINSNILGRAAGDHGSTVTITLGIYYKRNGTVSTSNYDYRKVQSFSVVVGSYNQINLAQDLTFNSPTDYVEVLFTFNTTGMYIIPEAKILMQLSNNNPLVGRFAIFEDLT